MTLLATDWATISSLATGAGTLVLAIATFAAVRSSNRSARIAEAALQEQRRPVLAPSRLEDPKQKIMFLGGHWVSAEGGRAAVEHQDGIVYLAISLRNVGSGIAVCQGWTLRAGLGTSRDYPTHAPLDQFRLQTRDLYIPAADIGMWQGALRHPDDPSRIAAAEAIDARQSLTVELLYTDQIGGQRTISRIGLIPTNDMWLASLNRHWYLDWDGPRPESLTMAAAEVVLREHDAAQQRRAAREQEHPRPVSSPPSHLDDAAPGLLPNVPSRTDTGADRWP
ncbi:MAG: hypothetical protein KGQ66_10170 [Acidobacteriota bacterium]|nr:hypothetical protein [Acidobacteriota bacterium]